MFFVGLIENYLSISYTSIFRSNSSDIEAIVSDLVHNFLIPTIHKVLVQRQKQSDSLFMTNHQ